MKEQYYDTMITNLVGWANVLERMCCAKSGSLTLSSFGTAQGLDEPSSDLLFFNVCSPLSWDDQFLPLPFTTRAP